MPPPGPSKTAVQGTVDWWTLPGFCRSATWIRYSISDVATMIPAEKTPLHSPLLDGQTADRQGKALALLSNPARLRLAVAIYRSPASTVVQLAEDIDLQPNHVSKLLGPMRQAGLVSYGATGRATHYWLSDDFTRTIVAACTPAAASPAA